MLGLVGLDDEIVALISLAGYCFTWLLLFLPPLIDPDLWRLSRLSKHSHKSRHNLLLPALWDFWLGPTFELCCLYISNINTLLALWLTQGSSSLSLDGSLARFYEWPRVTALSMHYAVASGVFVELPVKAKSSVWVNFDAISFTGSTAANAFSLLWSCFSVRVDFQSFRKNCLSS